MRQKYLKLHGKQANVPMSFSKRNIQEIASGEDKQFTTESVAGWGGGEWWGRGRG
jgi:hypothetical protein